LKRWSVVQTIKRRVATVGDIRPTVEMGFRGTSQRKLQHEFMNMFLLSTEETEAARNAVELSRTEVAINHWIDIAEAWLDRYIVTPLLGPNESAVR